jgi:tetratricopeptide (TPR) repeat protein
LTQGRLKEAENQFKQALKLAQEECRNKEDQQLFFIGNIYFILGNYEGCLKELKKNLALLKNWPQLHGWPLYMTALAYLEKNSTDQTQKAEADLLEWANNRMNKEKIRLYYLFRGKKEKKQKNFSGAIEYLNKALSLSVYKLYPAQFKAWFLDPLARVYLESGNMEKAQTLFEEIISLTMARHCTGDVYAKAFYELGKIYQQKGQNDKAVEHYNKFINLWKNCDPIFQSMVEEARKRLSELVPGQE